MVVSKLLNRDMFLVPGCWFLVFKEKLATSNQQLGTLLVLTLILVACGKEAVPPLPQGIQTLTGVIVPAEISLVRRGTHALRMNDEKKYYLESSAVNLRKYEYKEVVLEGLLEHNTDPQDLPVVVVERIVEVLEETFKEWQLRSLGVTLEAPELWNGVVKEEQTEFRTLGVGHPIVRIRVEELGEPPAGLPIVLDGQRATREVDEASGDQIVTLERKEDQLVFYFTPGQHPDADTLRQEWLTMLKSVSLAKERRTEETPRTGTGTGAGMPCGGPAGILCPEGMYCDVTHLEENIGICQRI